MQGAPELILYSSVPSSSSERLRIVLHFKGLKFEDRRVQAGPSQGYEDSEALAWVNPRKQVPVLCIDGAPLAETSAVAEYLEERYPDPPLLPADPRQRAVVRMIVQRVNAGIQPLQNRRTWTRSWGRVRACSGPSTGSTWGCQVSVQAAPPCPRPAGTCAELAIAFAVVVRQLSGRWHTTFLCKSLSESCVHSPSNCAVSGPRLAALEETVKATAGKYCVGDSVTLADVYLAPQVKNAILYKLDTNAYPTLERIAEALELHPAFQAANASNQPS